MIDRSLSMAGAGSMYNYLSAGAPACAFYVSSANGSDTAAGTSAAPFLTLPRAAAALRGIPRPLATPALACVRAGIYAQQPLILDHSDSGSSAEAFSGFYSVDGDGAAVISGGVDVPLSPIDPGDIGWGHIPASSRGAVLVADLFAAGLTRADLGNFSVQDGFAGRCVGPPLDILAADGTPQWTARWPNALAGKWGGAFATTQLTWANDVDHVLAEPSSPFFEWSDVDDIWLHGYWWWQWNSVYVQAAPRGTWNATSGRVPILPPYTNGASNFSGAARYYVLNSLSALDDPGEFVVNRTSGRLYWLPPLGTSPKTVTLAISPVLVSGYLTKFFALSGFTLVAARGSAVQFLGDQQNATSQGLLFSNLTISHAGTSGIDVYNYNDVTARGNHIFNTGGGGLSLSANDEGRASLQPTFLHVADNTVHDFERFCFTYNFGVSVHGVAALIERNLIYNAPHAGVTFTGNDLMFRYNVLHHLTQTTFDNAALYFYPNDWTIFNMTIRNNFAYLNGFDESTPCNFRTSCLRGAFYQDNGGAGLTVEGNVVYNPSPGGWNQSEFFNTPIIVAFNNDGGRNTAMRNNIVVDSPNGTYNSAGGIAYSSFGQMLNTSVMYAKMRAVHWNTGTFAAAYPELSVLNDFYTSDCATNPACGPAPWGDSVTGNVFVNVSNIMKYPPEHIFNSSNFNVSGNLFDVDPRFEAGSIEAARATLNFQLAADSPAYAMGFERIPMECFGPWSGCE